MKLNPSQIRKVVKLIITQLEQSGLLQGKDVKQAEEVIELVITNDLKKEEQIEKEASALIKKYSAGFHSEDLDFELLFKRAKQELAKKKGFKL